MESTQPIKPIIVRGIKFEGKYKGNKPVEVVKPSCSDCKACPDGFCYRCGLELMFEY